ncbi:TPA: signal recognition particle-docking protein FtsY [Neisseria bacilliformis]
MALFDFLFKRKTDTPPDPAQPPVSDGLQDTQRPSENTQGGPNAPEPAAETEREKFLNEIRNTGSSSQRSGLLRPADSETENGADKTAGAAPAAVSDGLPDAAATQDTGRPSENPSDSAETAEQTPAATSVRSETAAEAADPESATEPEQTAEPEPENPPESPEPTGWAARLKQGLGKSRDKMAKSLAGVFGGGKIDDELYEELETVLLTSDMGIEATEHIMEDVRRRVSLKGLSDSGQLRRALKESLYELLAPLEQPLEIPDNGQPFVIMMAGINGAGKTTSIGKLAKYFQQQGKTVILAAGDTFRAAAREQLQEWGARNGVTVVSQAKGDSAAVCYDAVESAKARRTDIVLADTAGRLPTQLHLMEEIKKVKRVLQKAMSDAPHEIIVVLDANIGQNAVNQVIAFDDALGVTGLIVTKLDGTAKGGVLAALAAARPIPVRYIGVGEGIDDLRPFNARAFVDALIDG